MASWRERQKERVERIRALRKYKKPKFDLSGKLEHYSKGKKVETIYYYKGKEVARVRYSDGKKTTYHSKGARGKKVKLTFPSGEKTTISPTGEIITIKKAPAKEVKPEPSPTIPEPLQPPKKPTKEIPEPPKKTTLQKVFEIVKKTISPIFPGPIVSATPSQFYTPELESEKYRTEHPEIEEIEKKIKETRRQWGRKEIVLTPEEDKIYKEYMKLVEEEKYTAKRFPVTSGLSGLTSQYAASVPLWLFKNILPDLGKAVDKLYEDDKKESLKRAELRKKIDLEHSSQIAADLKNEFQALVDAGVYNIDAKGNLIGEGEKKWKKRFLEEWKNREKQLDEKYKEEGLLTASKKRKYELAQSIAYDVMSSFLLFLFFSPAMSTGTASEQVQKTKKKSIEDIFKELEKNFGKYSWKKVGKTVRLKSLGEKIDDFDKLINSIPTSEGKKAFIRLLKEAIGKEEAEKIIRGWFKQKGYIGPIVGPVEPTGGGIGPITDVILKPPSVDPTTTGVLGPSIFGPTTGGVGGPTIGGFTKVTTGAYIFGRLFKKTEGKEIEVLKGKFDLFPKTETEGKLVESPVTIFREVERLKQPSAQAPAVSTLLAPSLVSPSIGIPALGSQRITERGDEGFIGGFGFFGFPRRKPRYKKIERIGFNTYVKSKGKFKRVSTMPLSRMAAMDLGARLVDNSTARTMRIEPIKQTKVVKGKKKEVVKIFKKELPKGDGYFGKVKHELRSFIKRGSKKIQTPNQWIEKSKYAIDSPGEKKGLAVGRLISNLKKQRFNLLSNNNNKKKPKINTIFKR